MSLQCHFTSYIHWNINSLNFFVNVNKTNGQDNKARRPKKKMWEMKGWGGGGIPVIYRKFCSFCLWYLITVKILKDGCSHKLVLICNEYMTVCVCVCVCACVRARVCKHLQPWTILVKLPYNRGRPRLSETRHSVAYRISMHIKKEMSHDGLKGIVQ